jgi:hypothetical protein
VPSGRTTIVSHMSRHTRFREGCILVMAPGFMLGFPQMK